jgi:hypothetical protein
MQRRTHCAYLLTQLLAEIRIHRSLSHRYIVGFESYFEDPANVYIMLELCPNQVRASRATAAAADSYHRAKMPSRGGVHADDDGDG